MKQNVFLLLSTSVRKLHNLALSFFLVLMERDLVKITTMVRSMTLILMSGLVMLRVFLVLNIRGSVRRSAYSCLL